MGIAVQLLLNGIIAGAIYALVALGFNLIYGATKFFNLAHGALTAVGGYAVFFFAKLLGFSAVAAIPLGIAVAGIIGWLLNLGIYQPLRMRKASNTVLLVASLGAFIVIQALIAILFTSQFQIISQNIGEIKTYEIFGGIITQTQLVILATTLAIMAVLAFVLWKTLLGRMIRAISDDAEVAAIIGIPAERIIGYVFLIGSAIAGLGGILVGYETGLEPTMGMSLLLKGVIASIIGGIGNVFGGVLGAFLLGFIENFGIWKIAGQWKDAIAFGVLILFLLFRPQGILRRR